MQDAAAMLLGLGIGFPAALIVTRQLNRWIERPRFRNRSGFTVNGDMVGRNYSYKGEMATFSISGRSFRGQNISITNDRIVIDGKDVTDEYDIKPAGILEIKITEGVVGHLTTDANVSAGDVAGDVDAGGNISCGSVGGDVDAGGNVSCGKVGGDVDAGGNVRHA